MATIVKLPDSTIQMIAAGEVITKPVNVVKELLENSLDAGATNIRIILEHGGVKVIEIIDNGHGVARMNAELLCCRHSTSKLTSADDLTRLTTFGFRGEALASVSEMALVEVRSFNMEADNIGWHAKYRNGKLVEPPKDKYLQNAGTQIKVTDLFSNVQQRKRAIHASFVDERKSIVDLITSYAIHHRDRVTMSLSECNSVDLLCLLAPVETKSCIGMFFGLDMQQNCIEMHIEENDNFKLKADIIFSYKKSTISSQQSQFTLFVNNRLVKSPYLKREIEALANANLNMKQTIYMTYISLSVPPCDVDVNMHPAKTTVALHYQEEITTLLIKTMREKLDDELSVQVIVPSSNTQKTIGQLIKQQPLKMSQATTPKVTLTPQAEERLRIMAPACLSQEGQPVSQKTTPVAAKRPHDLIHNDSSQQTLDQIVPPRRPRQNCSLSSIDELRKLVIKEQVSEGLARTIKDSTFVGIFDHNRAFIQYDTKLYAINLKAYLKEQNYQFYLYDIGNFPPIDILPPGNRIRHMISIYLNDIKKHEPKRLAKYKHSTCATVVEELLKHLTLYEDYLSLRLTENEVLTIPCLIPNIVPNLLYLGKFLVELANFVDYDDEKLCFLTMGRTLADFYSEPPANLKNELVSKRYRELVERKLYHAIKSYLFIPEWLFTRENICQMSDTKDLYKVFERC